MEIEYEENNIDLATPRIVVEEIMNTIIQKKALDITGNKLKKLQRKAIIKLTHLINAVFCLW